jgi:aspartyl-tRNA(Asn)/glutamyl-tRNA(Gln) amidotransferase subunit A
MQDEPLHYAAVTGVAGLVQQQRVSATAVVRHCLERIARLNGTLNAFITVLSEGAIQRAREADAEIAAGNSRGVLHGIPIAIKDFFDIAGVRTTAAFERFETRVPARTAASVDRLAAAGAIVVGKTNMHTLGMGTTGLVSHFGPVKNPWNADVIPGGSSSGSAAAVASGLCFATLDTDAIGSCRLPAACCGVTGFKPTFGTIDLAGILDGEQPPDETIRWLSHAGITTRTADDASVVARALGVDVGSSIAQPRIGVANNVRMDDEVRVRFEEAVRSIEAAGYRVTPVAAPLYDLRQGISAIETDRAAVSERTFSDIDLILLPTTPSVTPLVDAASENQLALSPENTSFANYYGLPAISVPCGFDSRGCPVGLQIAGKPRADGTVLELARAYERLRDSAARRRHPVP